MTVALVLAPLGSSPAMTVELKFTVNLLVSSLSGNIGAIKFGDDALICLAY
jgi:hypothetical protein